MGDKNDPTSLELFELELSGLVTDAKRYGTMLNDIVCTLHNYADFLVEQAVREDGLT